MLPLTLPALLAAAAPLLPLEACPVCVGIAPTCSRIERRGETFDGLPTGVSQLRELFGRVTGWKPSIEQCPKCHRLYQYESGYEYLVDGSEDYTTYDRIDDVEQFFHSDWFTRVRVNDPELVGNALEAAVPHKRRVVRTIAPRTFFRRHCVVHVELDYGPNRVWLALPDDHATMTILTGNPEGLAQIAAVDPPLDIAARARDYAAFADKVTSEPDG